MENNKLEFKFSSGVLKKSLVVLFFLVVALCFTSLVNAIEEYNGGSVVGKVDWNDYISPESEDSVFNDSFGFIRYNSLTYLGIYLCRIGESCTENTATKVYYNKNDSPLLGSGSIYGNKVLYSKNWELFLYDIDTRKTNLLRRYNGAGGYTPLYGARMNSKDIITFLTKRNGTSYLYYCNIKDALDLTNYCNDNEVMFATILPNEVGYHNFGKFDAFENLITYERNNSIYIYDILKNSTVLVDKIDDRICVIHSNPSIYGDYIAYFTSKICRCLNSCDTINICKIVGNNTPLNNWCKIPISEGGGKVTSVALIKGNGTPSFYEDAGDGVLVKDKFVYGSYGKIKFIEIPSGKNYYINISSICRESSNRSYNLFGLRDNLMSIITPNANLCLYKFSNCTCPSGQTCNPTTGNCEGGSSLGLKASYPFEGNANDGSGNGNNGVVNGATLTAGKIGQGYSFDGVNDYINLGNAAGRQGNLPFTISAWVNVRGGAGVQGIISRGNLAGSVREYFLGFSGNQFFWQRSNGSTYDTLSSSNNKNANTWYNVVAWYNGSLIKIFVNGVEEGSKTSTISAGSRTNQLDIGSVPESTRTFFFNGIIDEVKVWNYALSQSEILNEYNRGNTCTPQCSGKQCGSDGCGGSCGNCLQGQTCNPTTGNCEGSLGKKVILQGTLCGNVNKSGQGIFCNGYNLSCPSGYSSNYINSFGGNYRNYHCILNSDSSNAEIGALCGYANYNKNNGWSSSIPCNEINPRNGCPSGYIFNSMVQTSGKTYDKQYSCVKNSASAQLVPGILCGRANYNKKNRWSGSVLCKGYNPKTSCPANYERTSIGFNGGNDIAYFCVLKVTGLASEKPNISLIEIIIGWFRRVF